MFFFFLGKDMLFYFNKFFVIVFFLYSIVVSELE